MSNYLKRPVRLFLFVFSLVDIVLFTILYGEGQGWNSTKFAAENIGLDFLVLVYIRGFSHVLLVFSTCLLGFSADTKYFKYRMFYKAIFWISFLDLLLLCCKFIVLDYNVESSSFMALALAFGVFEYGLVWKIPRENRSVLNRQRRKTAHLDIVDLEIEMLDGKESDSSELKKEEEEANESKAVSLFQLATLLKPYFWPNGCLNKLRCFLTFFFLACSKGANLYAPIFIGNAVAKLAEAPNVDAKEVYTELALFCMITLAGKYCKELQRVVYLKVQQVAYTQVAEITFNHLHSLSLEWHLQKKMGSVLRSLDRGINAASRVVSLLFLNLLPTIGETIAIFVIFYTTFDLPFLSATVLVSTVLYGVITVQVTLWRKKYRKKTNEHDNSYHDKATDSIINYETVKYFTAEDFEVARYVDSISEFQKFSKCVQATLSLLNAMQQTIIQLALFTCLYVVASEILDNSSDADLNVGDFVTVQVYVLNLFAPLSFLGSIYDTVIQSIVDMQNLSELLGESPDVVDKPDAQPLLLNSQNPETTLRGSNIRFNHVSFHYPSNPLSGLRDVSFDVPAGTTIGIVGSTGAGKTTISRLLFRFYDPVEGSIEIDNQNIADITQKSLRQAIGVVPQDTVLFNDTVRHNIAYGKLDATDEEIEAACKSAQILDFILSLPEGFDTYVGERGLKLSGGEKQRVAIARCLLKNPPIVLLDEATSALDNKTERSVQVALNNLTTERTTMVIAHRLTTIQNAEQIIVLERGEIIEKGIHSELLRIPNGLYASMWSQLDVDLE